MSSVNVTDAFQSVLKTLCLSEFPCGNGFWRKQTTVRKVSKNYGKQYITLMDKTEPQFSTTLTDYDASKMHIETLQTFVSAKHSPWTSDYSWSDQARSLREIAVKTPELLRDSFIHQHFRTLRLTDKNIHDVDEQLLKFTNLEHLTLSANYIRNVNSKNLPRKLLSLELNSNQVSELFSLCVDPPELVHLGLGNNCLTYVDDYLSGEHWPALLSLDLSYNDLSDLPETLRKLKTLPNLRNLILMGNPMTLTPGYRGFVVDNLGVIDLLDDQRIEADERHRFSKMSRLTEQELCQCVITFSCAAIRNAPIPIEVEHPEEQPEYPIITRNYYVEFHYIDAARAAGQMFNFGDGNDIGFDFDAGGLGIPQHRSEASQGFMTPRSMPMSGMPLSDMMSLGGEDNGVDTFFTALADGETGAAAPAKVPTNIIRTDKQPWSDNIELNWSLVTKRDDLLAVRNFLQGNMQIDVMEETILSYPKEEDEVITSAKGKKKAEPEAAKKDDKKGKKKKDMDADMRHEPPEYNVLASFECSLLQLLNGEFTFNKTLSKSGAQSRIPSALSARAESANAGKKDKKGKDGKGKDGQTERKKSGKEAKKDQPAKKSAGKTKPVTKTKKGKKTLDVEHDPNEPPRPLEVDINVTMHHWSTTLEANKATAAEIHGE